MKTNDIFYCDQMSLNLFKKFHKINKFTMPTKKLILKFILTYNFYIKN